MCGAIVAEHSLVLLSNQCISIGIVGECGSNEDDCTITVN